MSYDHIDPEKLILRDLLARDRTVMANERTLLAYVRTGMMLLLTGFSLLELIVKNRPWVSVLAAVLLVMGGLMLALGVWRFWVIRKDLRRLQLD